MDPIFKVNDQTLQIKTKYIPSKGSVFSFNETDYSVNNISYEVNEAQEMIPIIHCREKPKPFKLTRMG